MKKKHHHKKKPSLFKKWTGKLHLWFGLGIGFLIFIISITGALYVFKDEVENFTEKYPDTFPKKYGFDNVVIAIPEQFSEINKF